MDPVWGKQHQKEKLQSIALLKDGCQEAVLGMGQKITLSTYRSSLQQTSNWGRSWVRGGEFKLWGSCSIGHSLSSALSLHSMPLRWGCCCVAKWLCSPACKGRQGPASRSSAPGLSASLSQVLTKQLAAKPSVYLYGKIISSHQILSVC